MGAFGAIKSLSFDGKSCKSIVFGNTKLWEKPEYQQVEWIETDGNSWFVSGFTPNLLDNFTIEYRHAQPDADNWLWGSGATNAGSDRFMHRYKGLRLNNAASSFVAYFDGELGLDGQFHTIKLDFTPTTIKGYCDGSLLGTHPYCNWKTYQNFGIFCNNYNGSPQSNKAVNGAKLSYWKVTDNDTNREVIDLIPCYRKSDGEIGMYDLVSKIFFTNAGSGAFTKGADVNV